MGPQPAERPAFTMGSEYTASRSFDERISMEVPIALSGSNMIAFPALTSTCTVCANAFEGLETITQLKMNRAAESSCLKDQLMPAASRPSLYIGPMIAQEWYFKRIRIGTA